MPIDVFHIRSSVGTPTRDSPGVVESEVEWEGETARIWFRPRAIHYDLAQTIANMVDGIPQTFQQTMTMQRRVIDHLTAVLVDWEFQQPVMVPDPDEPGELIPLTEPNPDDPEGEPVVLMETLPLKRKSLRGLPLDLVVQLYLALQKDQGPNATASTESSGTSSVAELKVVSPSGIASSAKLNGGGRPPRARRGH